jgi:hypothetical protein
VEIERVKDYRAPGPGDTEKVKAEDAAYFGQIIAYNEARFREGKIAEVDFLRVKLEGERVRAAAASMQQAVGQTMPNL